jgi:hypothetical protein
MIDMKTESIKTVKDFKTLTHFLAEELSWPIDPDNVDVDDLVFEYQPEDIGLSDKFAAKVQTIKQIRPLDANQPWSIFWIDFENKKLPLTVLRRILNVFVTKKRGNTRNIASKDMEDIMFVSGHGEDENRAITFAHFKRLDDVETIREFYWDGHETKFEHISSYLEKLEWPSNTADIEAWRQKWKAAFTGSTREAITTSDQLAKAMAYIAKNIRDRVLEVLEVEHSTGPVHKLYDTFKSGLVHDMSTSGFADMYAQTITYGLFSARTMDTDGHFELHEVIDLIPTTNPFLKSLFRECFKSSDKKFKIDLDELGVGRLVDLFDNLNRTDGTDAMQRILAEFGRQTLSGQEDPVIHFYEGFLEEYDKSQKIEKGVFYTPDPVVKFIVKSVHEQLKTEFGLEMGLADNTSWAEMVSKGKAQYPVDPATGRTNKEWIDKIKGRTFVQILDPATGTGTFIKHTIELIHSEVKSKHQRDKIQIPWLVYWNDYVYKNLLPRIYGFELMMASYSVAHMKIGMYLKSLGYKFEKEQRLNIYLTNSLEPHNLYNQRDFFFNSIGAEAEGANNVKCNRLFTVVIGNPPYSINSSNMSDYQVELVKKYKYINGVKLNERGALQLQKNTNDDYIKFFAFSQKIIAKSGIGIVGFISNNNFIDARTLRGFRWNLLDFFNTIRIYDLHGDSEKGELSPDGSPDENVFNIKKGVAISFLLKMDSTNNSKKNEKSDIWGLEGIKYKHLNETSWYELERESIEPAEPNFLFSYVDKDSISAYLKGESLEQIFDLYSSGIITARDNLTINFDKEILMEKVNDLVTNQSFEVLRERHEIAKDSTTWKLSGAINDLIKSGPSENNLIPITYRLFDDRYTYYTGKVIGFYTNPRLPVMQHLKDEGNIALCCCKQVKSSDYFQHVFVTQNIVDSCFISNKTSETGYAFPLFIKRKNGELNIDNQNKTPNLKLDYVKKLSNILQIDFSEQKDFNSKNNFSCYDIFDFVYAILNSWKFRRTYKDFLKIDFPRIPNPKDNETFWRLVKLGGELREIHLLQSHKVNDSNTSFPVAGNNEIGKSTAYKNNKVYINSEQYFDVVPEIAWNFYIGGYQPAQKWLKDRKGRVLTAEDIIHYQKIIVALTETDRIMKEIDNIDFLNE